MHIADAPQTLLAHYLIQQNPSYPERFKTRSDQRLDLIRDSPPPPSEKAFCFVIIDEPCDANLQLVQVISILKGYNSGTSLSLQKIIEGT